MSSVPSDWRATTTATEQLTPRTTRHGAIPSATSLPPLVLPTATATATSTRTATAGGGLTSAKRSAAVQERRLIHTRRFPSPPPVCWSLSARWARSNAGEFAEIGFHAGQSVVELLLRQ